MMDGGVSWMWLWPILVLVGLLLLGYVAVRLIRSGGPRTDTSVHAHSTALQVLDERYARGEIDENEYRTRRETLQ